MATYGKGLYGQGLYGAYAAKTAKPTPGATVPIALGAPAATVTTDTTFAGLDIPIEPGPPALQTRLSLAYTAAPFMDDLVGDPPHLWEPTSPVAEHILGIGPWSPHIPWRGAPNWGATATSTYPSVPIVPLPPATSTSFTLRLDGGSEARADFELARDQGFYVEKMTTDLWWRRRDPATGDVDILGRFNADKVDMSQTRDGLRISCTFIDYRQIVGERLIMQYAKPELATTKDKWVVDGQTFVPLTGQSSWAKGTAISTILEWVVPKNINVDRTAISTVNLGTIKEPVEFALGASVEEAMDTVLAASTTAWEWWIDCPDTLGSRPRLRLATRRGRNTGITLTDNGDGLGPITEWSIQDAAQDYANTLYFIGGKGGAVVTDYGESSRYMQRDAQVSDSSYVGNEQAIALAAQKKLAEILDPRPSLTITLAPGFWQGPDHIGPGDTIGVYIVMGAEIITSNYRVMEVNGTVDQAGAETITLALGKPSPNKDPRSRYSVVSRLVRLLKNYERME